MVLLRNDINTPTMQSLKSYINYFLLERYTKMHFTKRLKITSHDALRKNVHKITIKNHL